MAHRKIDKRKRNALGPILAAYRREHALTQEQLAERCSKAGWDIDWQTIKKLENRERQLLDFELIKLVRVLGLDLSTLEAELSEPALEEFFPADRFH